MKRNFSKDNKYRFKETLKNVQWQNILKADNETNVDDLYDKFLNIVRTSFEASFPKKYMNNNKRDKKPWYHQPNWSKNVDR